MDAPEKPDKETLEKLARETHFKLQEKLVQLRSEHLQDEPTLEEEQLAQLQQETARLNRELFDQHFALYQLEGNPIVLDRPWLVNKFFNWRIKKLEDNERQLDSEDREKYGKLFRELTYQRNSIEDHNHWNIIYQRKNGYDPEFFNGAHIHDWLEFRHIIAAYMKGFDVSFFVGNQMLDGEEPIYVSDIHVFNNKPRGGGVQESPRITINQEGILESNQSGK